MRTFKELFKDITGDYVAIYDIKNKKFLYDRNGDYECFPASMTKVLCALTALEYLKMDDIVEVGEEQDIVFTSPDPSLSDIKCGEKWTLREMLYASLLPSGCDAAYTIGYCAVKDLDECKNMTPLEKCEYFADRMNDYAKKLGCVNTHFYSLDGNDHFNKKVVRHLTSARDMCLIFTECLNHPELLEIMGTYEKVIKIGDETYDYKNTNRLINPNSEYFNQYVIGGKTGTTNLAGYCLGTLARKDDLEYAVVVCYAGSGADRFKDSNKIYDYLFNELDK